MKTIQLTNKNIHQGHLVLINRQHEIHADYKEGASTLLAVTENQDVFMTSHAGTMLARLLETCQAENEIIPISGYRSLREQQQIYDDSMKENGEEFTRKFVAFPGCSEHQTGLAVDVARQMDEIDFICPDFPYSGICQKFRDKASDYGFIERYQKDKEYITGISQEPWHFRYVGYPHAKIIENNGFSLEEYIRLLRSHPYKTNPLLYQSKGDCIEISYVKMNNQPSVSIPVPESPYQMSGNNVDGVVITVWRTSEERDGEHHYGK